MDLYICISDRGYWQNSLLIQWLMQNSCKIYHTDQILVNIPAGFTGTLLSVLFENGTESTECRSFPCALHVCLKECHWRAFIKAFIYPSIYEYLLYAYMKQNKFTINCSRFLKTHTHLINMLIYTCAPCKAWYI